MKQIVLVSYLLIFLVNNISAQKDTVPTKKDILDLTLEELMNVKISGANRYVQIAKEVPNSVIVITQQQISDRGYHHLSDLLKDVPGFDISENAGRFGELYSLRGITGNDRFLVLINGEKLNPVSGTFISIGNSISIKNAVRVEVIYGPASAMYGADAFSGIVNIVINNEALKDKQTEIVAYADFGSFNSMEGGLKYSVNINKNLVFNFDAMLYKSEGFDILGSDLIYDIIDDYAENSFEYSQPVNDHSIFCSLDYKDLSINYYRRNFNEGNAFGHNPSIYIYSKDNIWKTTSNMLLASYKKEFINSGSLSVDVSYKNHCQDRNTMFYKWKVPGVVGESYKQYMTGTDNSVHGVLTYAQQLNEKFQFVVGLENEFVASIPPYANDQVLGESVQCTEQNFELIREQLTVKDNRFAGFGQYTYTPFTFLNYVFGFRYDYSTRNGGVLNPRTGLVFSLGKYSKIKLIYGRAFQSPSLFYQYEQFGTPNVVMFSAAEIQTTNPYWTLKNQIVNSLELSFSQQIGDNVNVETAIYYNSLNDLIERNLFVAYPTDSVYNKYFDNYTGGLRNENIGIQEVIGAEFSFKAKLSKKLLIHSYYSYTDVVSLSDLSELQVPRIARHKVWFGLTAQNLLNFITVSARFKYIGDMYNANQTVFADNIQPGYHCLDVYFSTNKMSKYFNVFADFKNITNQKNTHAGLYGQSGTYTAVIPQPGFIFSVGIEFFAEK